VVVLAAIVAFIVGKCWWISRHYVATAATGWRYTTWEGVEKVEASGTWECTSVPTGVAVGTSGE
jgi:hypothetical protein